MASDESKKIKKKIRPNLVDDDKPVANNLNEDDGERKGRGRPKKDPAPLPFKDNSKKIKKTVIEEDTDDEDDVFLPGMIEEEETTYNNSASDRNDSDYIEDDEIEEVLPGLEDNEEEFNDYDDTEDEALPGINDEDDYEEDYYDDDEEVEYVDEDNESLPGLEDEEDDDDEYEEIEYVDEDDESLPGLEEDEYTEEVDLPGLDDLDEDDDVLPDSNDNEEDEEEFLTTFEDDEEDLSANYNPSNTSNQIESIKPRVDYSMSSLNSLLTKDKKIVTFIGTTKNGTSFLVNNLAALFSTCGINTAILDMTKNKNSYYIYTNNEEELRNIAYNSISKLQKGFAEGIKVDKNVTVYTSLPNDGKDYSDAESILSTLVQNHSLVLIDCDFDTDPAYFASCQEIYLVQSMDILTIQPLTAFLRDLKAKGVLEAEKVRVVINKEITVKSLTTKAIIGGMSFYNDPAMSFMTELFNKDMVKACSIPFEDNSYSKYLDSLVNCNVSLRGYSKAFINKLKNLGDMVYPLVSKSTYGGGKAEQQSLGKKKPFSNNVNNTLNKMKRNY